jgi:hypothetical protein
MKLETDEANLRADSNRVDEIDLYDDLIAFTDLSPEEQKKESEPRVMSDSAPAMQDAGQFFYSDLLASNEPALDPRKESVDRSFELVAQSSYPVKDYPVETSSAHVFQSHQKKSDVDLDLAYLLRVTGPLVVPGVTASASLPQLVCSDCGTQSSNEDMFCVTCGGLLDKLEVPEASEAVEVKLVCDGCGSVVVEDEIFCPACGAVLEGF